MGAPGRTFRISRRPHLDRVLINDYVPGELKLLEGAKAIMPGDKGQAVEVELKVSIALEAGLRFTLRENGRTFGTGVITGIIE